MSYEERLALARRLILENGGKYTSDAGEIVEGLASEGFPPAVYALATWLLSGYGPVGPDLPRAVDLLKVAASSAIAEAWYDLAVCFEKGSGLPVSPDDALRCYAVAAMLGDRQSLFECGRCLYYGIGSAERISKALANNLLDLSELLGIASFEDEEPDK